MAVSLLACSSSDSGGTTPTTTTGGASASSGGATASTGGTHAGGASAGGASAGGASGASGASAGGSGGSAAAPPTGSAANGATLYASNSLACGSCHGTQGEGGIGPNISSSTTVGIASWTETQFHDAVRLGKSKSGAMLCPTMAQFSATAITDQGLADIYAFLLSTPANNTVAASAACMTK